MSLRRPALIVASALVTAFAFAATQGAFARGEGQSRGAGDGGGADVSGSGNSGDVPIGGYYGSGTDPNDKSGPGGIDWGSGGAMQKQISRDVFTRRSRDDFRKFRDVRNRSTADPRR